MSKFLISIALLLTFGLGQESIAIDPTTELSSVSWSGGDGNWSQRNKWIPSTSVPNNKPTEKFSVNIEGDGVVTVDTPVTVSELLINNRVFNLMQPLTTDEFVLNGAFVDGDAGLTVNGDLILKRGTLNHQATGPGAFEIGGNVIKRGIGFAVLAPFEGGGSYEIVVEQGTLRMSNGGQGTREGSIHIANREFARILTYDLSSLADEIHLNNATGFANQGAIVTTLFTGGTITGEIYLGEQGSVIGPNESLSIFGGIHGGSLDIVGSGNVILRSGSHTYTGTTSIGANGDNPALILLDDGAIQSTSEIVLGGRLLLNNDQQTIDDRLPDSAPIVSLGGLLDFDRQGATPVTEKIGQLRLHQGATGINSGGNNGSWIFNGIERSELATIDFGRNNVSDSFPFIRSEIAPILTNSIIGSWATINDRDFATNDELQGIVPLDDRVSRPNQIEGASTNDHVRIRAEAPQALTDDRTIATLSIERSGSDLNLAGHTLTLRQGGLLVEGSSSGSTRISQGQLTSGESVNHSVLYLHNHGGRTGHDLDDVNIRASIVDNSYGGVVSLVKSGDADTTLSGENTYTGTTTIQQGRLVFATADALPGDGVLWADSGEAILSYQSTEPKHLARLVLSQGGRVFAPENDGVVDQSDVEIDADEYVLESGSLDVSLAGNGTLRKTTIGIVGLGLSSPNFHGDIFVEDGVLIAGSKTSVGIRPQALGQGQTTILPGGLLVHASAAPAGTYMLLQADLVLVGGDVGLSSQTGLERWDFEGDWHVTADSRLLLFDSLGERETLESPTVHLLSPVRFTDGSGLTVLGEGEVDFQGGLPLAGDAFIEVEDGLAYLNEISALVDQATLQLRGGGEFRLPQVLTVQPSESFTVEVAQDVTASLHSGGILLGEGQTLAVNGQLDSPSPRSRLTIDGGTLTGDGHVGATVVNRSGQISPGNGIGTLTAGTLQQSEDGILLMEIFGGPTLSSDLLRVNSAGLFGTLHASLSPGGDVTPGDAFDLVVADVLTADELELVTEGFVGLLEVVTLEAGPYAGKQSLRLSIAVPEPCSASLLCLICMLLSYSRRVHNLRAKQKCWNRATG